MRPFRAQHQSKPQPRALPWAVTHRRFQRRCRKFSAVAAIPAPESLQLFELREALF
jgi:hypothetical protein